MRVSNRNSRIFFCSCAISLFIMSPGFDLTLFAVQISSSMFCPKRSEFVLDKLCDRLPNISDEFLSHHRQQKHLLCAIPHCHSLSCAFV